MPTYKETKVYTKEDAVKIHDCRAGKPKGWEFVAQYFNYEAWEKKEEDFMIFYGVSTMYEIPDINVTEYLTVAENEIPNGATILEKVHTKIETIAVEQVHGNAELDPKISTAAAAHLLNATGTPQAIYLEGLQKGIFDQQQQSQLSTPAVKKPTSIPLPVVPDHAVRSNDTVHSNVAPIISATKKMKPQASARSASTRKVVSSAVETSSSFPAPSQIVPTPVVLETPVTTTAPKNFVKISKSRTIGPIAARARFDRMYLNKISLQGTLERNSSEKTYIITLETDGSKPIPRLIKDGIKKVQIKV